MRYRRSSFHPVTLVLDEAHHRRGRPRMAEGSEADEILERFTALSASLPTSLQRNGATAMMSVE